MLGVLRHDSVQTVRFSSDELLMRSLIGIGLIGLLLGAFGHPERAVSTTRKVGELATERTFASATPYDGGFLVAWEDGRLGPPNLALAARQSTVYASRVTTQGTTLDPSGLRVSTAPFDQSDLCRAASMFNASWPGSRAPAGYGYAPTMQPRIFGAQRLPSARPRTTGGLRRWRPSGTDSSWSGAPRRAGWRAVFSPPTAPPSQRSWLW
jgi:hypothetical protein